VVEVDAGVAVKKTCTTCGRSLPATAEFFEKHKQCRGGISSRCKKCSNARAKQWRAENRGKIIARWNARYRIKHGAARELRDRYYRSNEPLRARATLMSTRFRVRARKLGLPLDTAIINPENLEAMLGAARHCPACGRAIEYRCNSDRQGVVGFPRRNQRSGTPSLDRVIPSLGYVRGNVAIICWSCNALKRDASLAEVEALARWMRRHLTENGLLGDELPGRAAE
jgi:predicted RNA-binding Zn-ribbon protein involved in translation (DUF1610 family)